MSFPRRMPCSSFPSYVLRRPWRRSSATSVKPPCPRASRYPSIAARHRPGTSSEPPRPRNPCILRNPKSSVSRYPRLSKGCSTARIARMRSWMFRPRFMSADRTTIPQRPSPRIAAPRSSQGCHDGRVLDSLTKLLPIDFVVFFSRGRPNLPSVFDIIEIRS